MEICYKHGRLQEVAANFKSAVREWGKENAKKLFLRIQQLKAASTLNDMHRVPGARFHPLKGDRKGQFALDLKHPKRLIIVPVEPVPRLEDGGIDLLRVNEIMIIEVVDYHG